MHFSHSLAGRGSIPSLMLVVPLFLTPLFCSITQRIPLTRTSPRSLTRSASPRAVLLPVMPSSTTWPDHSAVCAWLVLCQVFLFSLHRKPAVRGGIHPLHSVPGPPYVIRRRCLQSIVPRGPKQIRHTTRCSPNVFSTSPSYTVNRNTRVEDKTKEAR